MSLREAAQQALEACADVVNGWESLAPLAVRRAASESLENLRAALEQDQSAVKDSLTVGMCMTCGAKPIDPREEHFVGATASDGVTAPEDYSPQRVEAPHSQKEGDKTSPPLADRIADILVEDHIALMLENERLRAVLEQEQGEPVAWMYTGIRHDGTPHERPSLIWRPDYMDVMSMDKGAKAIPLYLAPPQRKPLTDEEIALIVAECSASAYRHDDFNFARAVERAHNITTKE